MIIENTDFNVEYWSRFSQDEFVSQCLRDRIFIEYENREELLKLAYQLIYDAAFITEKS